MSISGYITTSEAAKIACCNDETIRRWYNNGNIQGQWLDRYMLAINKLSLQTYVETAVPQNIPLAMKARIRDKNTMVEHKPAAWEIAHNRQTIQIKSDTATSYIYIKHGERIVCQRDTFKT